MADTWTVGGATSGYWATGNWDRATTPTMTRTIDSTEAKIGRSMKKWENHGRMRLCLPGVNTPPPNPLPATGRGRRKRVFVLLPLSVAGRGLGGGVFTLCCRYAFDFFSVWALVLPVGRVGMGTCSGLTSMPGRTRCTPLTITHSPALGPAPGGKMRRSPL